MKKSSGSLWPARVAAFAATAAVLTGLLQVPAGAAGGSAASAFLDAWSKVSNYTDSIVSHETTNDGSKKEDRTYHFAYLKPHYAKIDIIDGPGKGGGAVWAGGDTVRGHQGGFLSGIKLQVSIHDGRATSLRGDTVDYASFESAAQQIRSAKDPTEGTATVDGQSTDAVTITYPSTVADGVTKRVIYLSKATHLPVRRSSYAGDTLVKQETFSEVKLNPGLKPDDFT
jgi:outer membrane lipoprotein-sorting protein